MINVYTVSFFGHRELSDAFEAERLLEKLVGELIRTKEYIEFLVGHNGDFDTLASSVIRREMSANDYGNASLILVLPYMTAEYMNNQDSFKAYYNEIEICEKSADAHFRAAIQIRNRYMIDRLDLIVCYVERKVGGAYNALQYAEKNKIPFINLALSDM